MAHLTLDDVKTIAAAIANARGNRRGVPMITNILDVLPEKLRDEVLDDARAVMHAINATRPETPEPTVDPLHRSGFR